jgi:adenylate cyclase
VSSGNVIFAGEERVLSCFFSDIAGFTSVSERLGPTKTVRILNMYLDRMTEVLDSFDATINKFEGDGIFAFFGAPIELPEHSRLSCMAAISVQDALTNLCVEQRKLDDEFPNLTMRVGISTGVVVVGDCGSHRRFDYTAIGDTVNLAARLESANKAFGSKNMICQRTYDEAKEYIETRYLGQVRVVGKKNSVGIYELLGKSGTVSGEQKEFSQLFEKAVRFFQEKQFVKSETQLRKCLDKRPGDKSIQLYLSTIERFNKDGVPEDFDGGIELVSK